MIKELAFRESNPVLICVRDTHYHYAKRHSLIRVQYIVDEVLGRVLLRGSLHLAPGIPLHLAFDIENAWLVEVDITVVQLLLDGVYCKFVADWQTSHVHGSILE